MSLNSLLKKQAWDVIAVGDNPVPVAVELHAEPVGQFVKHHPAVLRGEVKVSRGRIRIRSQSGA